MVVILRKVVVVPGQPQKHAEDYTQMCTITATVQAILPYNGPSCRKVDLRTLTHCLQS